MVVNGCLLDEAYVDYNKKEKKKNKKEKKNEIDKNFNNSGKVLPNEIEDSYYNIDQQYYNPPGFFQGKPPENKPQQNINDETEYKRQLTNKDYKDFLDFQRNRYNYIHRKDVIETFSSVNDNFNDVLIFALFGMIFLIFTDYIYKLGKKSY